jgi:hypothetical protein
MINYIRMKLKVRAARAAGKLDGKSGIPFPNWAPDSVPYLLEIYSDAKKMLSKLEVEILTRKQNAATEEFKRKVSIEALENSLVRAREFEDESKIAYDKVKVVFDGDKAESPKSKFARIRSINAPVYVALLIAMIVGEFFITYPAFEKFLGDQALVIGGQKLPFISIFTAIGATALTVGFAHMAGVYLKLSVDREKPTPNWTSLALSIIGVLVFLTVFFLSVQRSGTADTTRLKQISFFDSKTKEDIFVVLFFFILQSALILTAAGLGFLRHSHHVDELEKVKKSWEKNRKIRVNLEKSITNSKKKISTDLSQVEKDLAAMYQVKSKDIESNYTKISGAYITANLRSRQEKLDGSVDPFKLRNLN